MICVRRFAFRIQSTLNHALPQLVIPWKPPMPSLTSPSLSFSSLSWIPLIPYIWLMILNTSHLNIMKWLLRATLAFCLFVCLLLRELLKYVMQLVLTFTFPLHIASIIFKTRPLSLTQYTLYVKSFPRYPTASRVLARQSSCKSSTRRHELSVNKATLWAFSLSSVTQESIQLHGIRENRLIDR